MIQADALLAGLLVALAISLLLRRRRPSAPVDATAAGVGAYLAWSHQIPPRAAVAVVAAWILGSWWGRLAVRWRILAAGLVVAAAATSRTGATPAAIGLVAGAGIAGAVLAARDDAHHRVPLLVCTLGALLATAAGGPDTEAAHAALGGLGAAILVDRSRRIPAAGFAPALLVAIVAVDAYRGRPGGLPAAAVALAVAAAGPMLAADPRTRRGTGVAVAAAVVAVVAARTIGLDAEATPTDVLIAAGAAVAVVGAALAGLVAAGRARRPPT